MVVPNVYVDVDLMFLLAENYDPATKVIHDAVGKPLLPISRDYMSRVFDLDLTLGQPIDITLLTNENARLKDVYKRLKLPTHRPRDGNDLRVFGEDEEPPYELDLFEEYFKYTYYSICQIMGIEAKILMDITPMVLATYVQMHDARPFDYVSMMVN